jgi:primosomal protein N''
MTDLLTAAPAESFAHLTLREKREYLDVLTDVVHDIRVELARAEAEQAALRRSLEAGCCTGSSCRHAAA